MRDTPSLASEPVRRGDEPPVAEESERGGPSVHAVERAVQLLDALAQSEAGISELARATGLHKATVHRLIRTLRRLGLVELSPDSTRYRLGLRLLELGGRVLARLDLRDVARPYLIELRDRTRLTVHMAVLDGTEVVYIDKLDSPANLRMASFVGTRSPAYCTALGKAILSALAPEQTRAILARSCFVARTRNTLTTPEALLEELAATRARGYAIDDMENEDGIRCVGAPVYRHTGQVAAAISCSGPVFSVTPGEVESLGRLVADVARAISRDMGYAGEPKPPRAGADR
ncbi:IclR family transcriptional regulator [Geochorda subterranea]|uniref:IclR family transcriptional regulator n=1 Tax=Geochorda subterranea TaxID=3109564 RepID=A0ABZ1BPZ8_9FIRM|nr:IclR family transcriptional regulator [Limnochorda sp. LNt]WRP14476.1 IclR family transcriptional regulator [Limnochorda sp. LNt]